MLLRLNLRRFWIPVLTLTVATTAHAQTLQGSALLHALERGGLVVVMRHASSPSDLPAKEAIDAQNLRGERQLDENGRATATAMGKALRELKIPVGEVFSSPAYRALQTVRLAELGTAKAYPELGDNGKSMEGTTEAQSRWLQGMVKQFPIGANTFIVTHNPNIVAAFPAMGTLADGEALVFGPDGKVGATVVAHIKIGEWPHLGS